MNSEELEQSLKAEIEQYMKTALAGMRQEAAEFQTQLQGRIDEAFKGFAERFEGSAEFDAAFASSVSEHLRLARDEGARVAADAMVAAESMGGGSSAPAEPARYDAIRDAVADISSQDSQSAILKSLVQHAEQFADRGAFFIIKNDHFVGWKVFGADQTAENAIREVHFPASADTVLGNAVAAGSTSTDGRSGDGAFLEPLNFGQPDRMVAIPLVARGKGVAVLYADGNGTNREALETLVRVAGVTVELRAAGHPHEESSAAEFEAPQPSPEPAYVPEPAPEPTYAPPVEEFRTADEQFAQTISDMPTVSVEAEQAPEPVPTADFSFASESIPFDDAQPAADAFQSPSFDAVPSYQPEPQPEPEVATSGAMVFDSGGSIEPAVPASSPFEAPVAEFQPAPVAAEPAYETAIEPVAVIDAQPAPAARYSDRPVDLPIDVPEAERRIHNDARRFARLLVSEIKLYNEKKVLEGRQAHDLYERLREAIDRSREMYDKRVQPPVAAKFDYFHYELVNSLAEGNAERLGGGYPGASV